MAGWTLWMYLDEQRVFVAVVLNADKVEVVARCLTFGPQTVA